MAKCNNGRKWENGGIVMNKLICYEPKKISNPISDRSGHGGAPGRGGLRMVAQRFHKSKLGNKFFLVNRELSCTVKMW